MFIAMEVMLSHILFSWSYSMLIFLLLNLFYFLWKK